MIKKLQARGEQRKGRGFGFVTLESEEMQLKAVEEMNGKEIDGREIAVKVAIDSPDKTDDHEHEHEHDHELEHEHGHAEAEGTEKATNGTDVATATATATS
jgi:RNA recognition motif-containing protein